jgi:hypothetical protein
MYVGYLISGAGGAKSNERAGFSVDSFNVHGGGQDEAANLDQLPGSELNVDIGHREFLEDTKKKSQRLFSSGSVGLLQ